MCWGDEDEEEEKEEKDEEKKTLKMAISFYVPGIQPWGRSWLGKAR